MTPAQIKTHIQTQPTEMLYYYVAFYCRPSAYLLCQKKFGQDMSDFRAWIEEEIFERTILGKDVSAT